MKFSALSCGRLVTFLLLLFHSVAYGQPGSSGAGLALEETSLTDACPNLAAYYQQFGDVEDSMKTALLWAPLADELMLLMPSCLRSSEYFALLGAAQLNSRQNSRAIESLERSLLLQPDGGAARVDYAQALYNAGQLFPALEINERLLAGNDLPKGLMEELQTRNELWQSDTKQSSIYLDVAEGYDSNLNGAPNLGEINLTLSGEEVSLSLGDAFKTTRGEYSNFRVANQFRVLAPDSQHSWSNEIRARISGDQRSDLLRFDSRYSFLKSDRARNWRAEGSLTHLLFGGSPLFSAANLSGRYQLSPGGSCSPSVELAGQRQYFRQQQVLNGIEGKLAGRVQCDLSGARGIYSGLSVELGLLHNYSLKSARPGGDRKGWQASLQWQSGGFLVHASQTQLSDRRGYSSILSGGARRIVRRDQLVLQYRRPLPIGPAGSTWFVNFFHQNQESNIDLFAARDTSLEFGLGFVF